MEFIDEEILQYCENHTDKEPHLLQQLNRETHAKVLNPRMLSGHLQGRFLAMISRLLQPKAILEIGTYTGYSTLCLCEGLAEGGRITTLDINDELATMCESWFNKSPYASSIDYRNGDATLLLPDIPGPFDLVFIDADKENYINYFKLVIGKVKPGGLIMADNVLWSGNVLQELSDQNRETRGITAFNDFISGEPGVEVVMLPVRDGISLIRKKQKDELGR